MYELKKLLLEVTKCNAEMGEKQKLVNDAEAVLQEEKALIGQCLDVCVSVRPTLTSPYDDRSVGG